MYDDYGTGMSSVDYVKVSAYKKDGEKTSLTVNPVGQFDPGGCLAFVSVREDKVMPLKTSEEFFDFVLSRIYFENLEVAFDMENYTLGNVLDYTRELEVDDDNSWYLNYFKRLDEKVAKFKEEFLAVPELKDYEKIEISQYHEASGELCDFVDYVCCPEGEEEDVLREFFEENLSPESEIDNIMECFEDGYYNGSGFEAEERYVMDYDNGTFRKTMTVTNVR